MLPHNALRTAFLVGAILLITGCDGSQQSESTATQRPVQSAQATPSVRPTIDPDLASGVISRFYRDLNNDKPTDIATIISSDFSRAHTHDWAADYGWIQNPKLQITSIHGDTAAYLLDYTYAGSHGITLFWERTGKWAFNHGSHSGWVLDKDSWDSIHLIGLALAPNAPMTPLTDTAYSDGHHTFDYDGDRYSFTADTNGWRIADLGSTATPPPGFGAPVAVNTPDGPYTQTDTTTNYVPPDNSDSSCDDASLQWKSEDGDWIGTDDGHKYHVLAGDESIVMGWTESDDLKICGDTIIDIDDDGSQVDTY